MDCRIRPVVIYAYSNFNSSSEKFYLFIHLQDNLTESCRLDLLQSVLHASQVEADMLTGAGIKMFPSIEANCQSIECNIT